MSIFEWRRKKQTTKPGQVFLDDIPDSPTDASDAENGGEEDFDTGIKRPLLYMFQHRVLPKAAFENHPELMPELTIASDTPRPLPFLHMRSLSQVQCMMSGIEIDDDTEAETELFSSLRVHPYPRNGYIAYVITMPEPKFLPEAYFSAIVYKDGESKTHGNVGQSTRYFALEKSFSPMPVLCEWKNNGQHINYGGVQGTEREDFVEAVFERIAAQLPENNRVLLEGGNAMLLMMMPPSSNGYHLVSVKFDDGTEIKKAKVYRMRELELPLEYLNKKIEVLSVLSEQD